MRAVIWTAEARKQYLSAFLYLADRNASAADKLQERIDGTVENLAKRPMGRPGYATDTFEKIVPKTPYVVVYELAGDVLYVLRLFHMLQNWRSWREGEGGAQ